MRYVVRNSFARNTIRSERISEQNATCSWCGGKRVTGLHEWLYRFHVDDDSGSRHSGLIAEGKLFCSRGCCEAYIGHNLDETKG
jgi:hypothetical protein